MRFVLISLGFLGWAFYEMSGGADFDPSEIKAARLAVEAEKQAAREKAQLAAAAKAQIATAETQAQEGQPEVTRVALNLTTLEPAAGTAAQAAGNAPRQGDAVLQNASVVTSSEDTPAIIPSLINPSDRPASTAAIAVTESGDMRTVSGNRVNVRGGPGTGYGVVGRLVRGDRVRVLEDNGAGWVRFEEADGTPGGWMADFLLAGG